MGRAKEEADAKSWLRLGKGVTIVANEAFVTGRRSRAHQHVSGPAHIRRPTVGYISKKGHIPKFQNPPILSTTPSTIYCLSVLSVSVVRAYVSLPMV